MLITGVVTVGHETKGMASTDTVDDDSNVEQLDGIPPTAIHRSVNLALVDADRQGTVPAELCV